MDVTFTVAVALAPVESVTVTVTVPEPLQKLSAASNHFAEVPPDMTARFEGESEVLELYGGTPPDAVKNAVWELQPLAV